MILTTDNRGALLKWAADRTIPGMRWEPNTRAIGVLDPAGGIRAVATYNMFYDGGCHMHVASDGSRAWANRGVLRAGFEYPFVQLGLSRLTAPIPCDNVASQILALKLGFSFEGRLRGYYSGIDAIIFGMTRDECRWVGQE